MITFVKYVTHVFSMWSALAKFILKNRIIVLVGIGLLTCFMVYHARQVRIAYQFTQFLPASDSASIEYEKFRAQFGQDGTVMIAGMQADSLFTNVQEFNDLYDLDRAIKKSNGIKDVLSATSLYKLIKNDSLTKFELRPLLERKPQTKQELDSVRKVINSLPFYDGVYDRKKGTTLIAVTFKDSDINTSGRIAIVDSLKYKLDAFGSKYHTTVHYSGLPFIRTVISRKVMNEMVKSVIIAIVTMAILLLLFFRSPFPVIFPLLVVCVGVAWSVAFIHLFGFEITVLTGIIPPLITVIGVPNCILLLNKYHTEFNKHGNKMQALSTMVEKIGISLFLANVTTAIGFAVFCSTRSQPLVEFGIVSSISVMATYVISLLLIPAIFSFLPPPKVHHLRHLERKQLVNALSWVDKRTQGHRKMIYLITAIVIVVSVYGISQIKAVGYIIDDLPKNDPVYTDMRYFEKNIGGILSFEVKIDARKPNGIFANSGRTLYKMDRFEKLLRQYPIFSRPQSVIEGIKYANQVYHDGEPKYYILPTLSDFQSIAQYFNAAKQKQSLTKAFIDSTKQYTRMDILMADIGSVKMKQELGEIIPRADSIFNYSAADKAWLPDSNRYKVTYTGTCLNYLRSNDFLVTNLIESVVLAIVLISIIMYILFLSARMVIIATLPSFIPLLITLGLMGFFDIHLKPSTILIFSIAFGISSDGTMYFLTKYRQEIKNIKLSISQVVSIVIRETGVSMIYTALILSCGFLVFVFSDFGGTRALGILVSVTLLMAYCSNLVLLPSFMLSMEQRMLRKELGKEPLIELDEENFDDGEESGEEKK